MPNHLNLLRKCSEWFRKEERDSLRMARAVPIKEHEDRAVAARQMAELCEQEIAASNLCDRELAGEGESEAEIVRRLLAQAERLELTRDPEASAVCLTAAARLTALEQQRGKVVEALDDLQQAEAEYRLMHDRHGDDAKAAGRAWDLMRRAGDKARALLSTLTKGVSVDK